MASYDPEWLDRVYNNRALVPDHARYFERWAADSVAAREALPCKTDLRYGPGTQETLDVFPAPVPDAPVLVFIHGGWWRALDKSDHSFVARAFNDRGVCVVMPNYALCPGTAAEPVTISYIARQLVRALEWTWRHIGTHGGDRSRITVAGHSAGGHLAAMLLCCDWPSVAADLPATLVRHAMSISGLHDLRPIRYTPFLANLGLTDDEARRLSPVLWPAPGRGLLHAFAGAQESEAFVWQAEQIRAAWGRNVVPVCEAVPGLNHFSIVDALADASHALHRKAMQLLEA